MKLSSCCAALLTATLLVPGVAGASGSSTGTLVGSVSCGADEATPATHIVVDVQGTSLNARTDGGGRFTLSDVPAAQVLTVDAVLDPNGSVSTSRFNVVVQPGQTLDIGNLDLSACPSTPVDVPAPDDQPQLWDGGAE